MSRRRRKKPEQLDSSAPGWMTTYGDMVTLLLVFFVLLYSFSIMDQGKFQGFVTSFRQRVGILDGGMTMSENNLIDGGLIGDGIAPSIMNLNLILREMSIYIETEGIANEVELVLTDRGLVVRLTGQILFDIGKADLLEDGKRLLDKIAELLIDIPNVIMIEGHTDNWPINNERFPSNWELSTARATNVVRYFIENTAIPPERLMAAGYSEYRPLYPNDTVENRAKNRRVEIVVLNSTHNGRGD